MKFKTGDIIVGKKSSNKYNHTCKKYDYVAEVILVRSSGITVRTLKSLRHQDIGDECIVDPRDFKLKNPELIELDISKATMNENFSVASFNQDYVSIRIFNDIDVICGLFIGENGLSFKKAKKILKLLGYKLIDSSKNKTIEDKKKSNQYKYGLSYKTLSV